MLQNSDHTDCHRNYNQVYCGTSANPDFNDFDHHNQFIEICYWYVSQKGMYGRNTSTQSLYCHIIYHISR